jgi:acetylornithine deacetylase
MPADPAVEAAALDALDPEALARDAAAAVRIPSVTGQEREALELLAGLAADRGLEVDLHDHDLAALRRHPGQPGSEAPRDELLGLAATLPGGGARLCLNGHVDVVGPGTAPWREGPWAGTLEDGRLGGRGSVDMKGAVVAALHAAAAVGAAGAAERVPTVVLQCVSSEEDGGLGTFAELERDAAFDACLIPEPTGFDVVCAQAGAMTCSGTIPGRTAHAAHRLEGCSAIDRYVAVHAALREHERRVNRDVAHPQMRELELPYPLLVGRVSGGQWSSQVPDRVDFTVRVGVPVGEAVEDARASIEEVVAAALDDGEAPATISWDGGCYAPAETSPDDPWVALVLGAVEDELGRPARVAGVPWGADMRLFTARGIPCTMVGTTGIERAHAVDEWVAVDELVALARVLVRSIVRFSGPPRGGRAR